MPLLLFMCTSVIKALDHLDHPMSQMLPVVHKERVIMSTALIDQQLIFPRYNHRFEKPS